MVKDKLVTNVTKDNLAEILKYLGDHTWSEEGIREFNGNCIFYDNGIGSYLYVNSKEFEYPDYLEVIDAKEIVK